MTTFIGFSTIGKLFGNTTLTDVELAKQDLLNHFYTRKGERLGKPSFGCIIQDLVFEQITDELQYEVKDEVRRIVKNDPRWSLEMLNVEVDDHTIICNLNLLYIKTSTLAQLYLKFTSEEI